MPPTPEEMLTAVSDSLAARTGRSLEQWLALVRSCGVDPLDQTAVRNWLRREHSVPQNSQWAIAAAARDRVDLGLRFSDPPNTPRLQPGGGPGQATHKVPLRGVSEVDAEIVQLLRVAYEQNA
jgi:Domain of unknown function (DUF4287)/Domain of unknown function (DUF5655)